MKKTYQNPKTDIVTITVAQMIANSPYGEPEKGFDLEDVVETPETSGNLSRRTVWDDEEDEEEENY